MMLSRRNFSKLTLASGFALPGTPGFAFFHNGLTPENLPERLAADLNDLLKSDCDGSFSVTSSSSEDAPVWSLDASVQLDWPPGTRRRQFSGSGQDIEEAYADLLDAVRSYYGSVWTMPDGTGCFA